MKITRTSITNNSRGGGFVDDVRRNFPDITNRKIRFATIEAAPMSTQSALATTNYRDTETQQVQVPTEDVTFTGREGRAGGSGSIDNAVSEVSDAISGGLSEIRQEAKQRREIRKQKAKQRREARNKKAAERRAKREAQRKNN